MTGGYVQGESRRTVFYVAVLDLLQHLWPHGGVALLVCVDALRAQVQPLADATGSLIRGHDCCALAAKWEERGYIEEA